MRKYHYTHLTAWSLGIALFGIVSCGEIELLDPPGIEVDIAADSIVFAVIGDFGKAGNSEKKVAEMVNSWNPDFIITTGDNNYEDGKYSTIKRNISDYYGDFIYNYDAPEQYHCNGAAFYDRVNRFFPSPGNHDAANPYGLIPYLNFFTLPQMEEYYHFTWGPVDFFSLNSATKGISDQQEWLTEEMGTANAPFRIVYFHHSPYSNGRHGNSEKMQWDYAGSSVDAVLTGHDHIYSVITREEDPNVHYVINGIGGKSLYECNQTPLQTGETNLFCSDSDYGAIRATATPLQLTLELYLVGNPTQAAHRLVIEPRR